MEQNLDDLGKLSDLKDKGIITEEEFRKKKEQLLQLSSNQKDKPQQSEEKTVKGEKWYQKPVGIIVLLFLFFPVGLFLMWKYADWHKYVKWGITSLFALIFIWSWVSSALAETPVITLSEFEKTEKTVTGSEYKLSGKVTPPSTELKVNGEIVEVKEDGSFTYTLSLKEGVNEIKIEANNSGKTAELVRKLTRELTAEEKAAKEAEEKRKAEEEAKKADDAAKAADKSPSPTKTEDKPEPTSSETVSQKNAVTSAISYLDYSGFSRDGLVTQLEFEKFSHADAVYGADNSGADWNEEAAEAAKSYMEYSAFSRGSLIDQLKFDKFTQAQAEYGANAVGL